MILVIADDLTGAAEIAGIALHYGLTAEIQTEFCPGTQADVLVFDSQTRSMTAEEVKTVYGDFIHKLKVTDCKYIFKKTDSALRGHILLEIGLLLDGLSMKRSILVPANPSRQRIIRNGRYLIENMPIEQTGFAIDPEFPVYSSMVKEILEGKGYGSVSVLKELEDAPGARIIVGETQTIHDIDYWIRQIDIGTLPSGAADFFEGFLQHLGYQVSSDSTRAASKTGKGRLFILGSASPESRRFISKIEKRGAQVFPLPCHKVHDDESLEHCAALWAESVLLHWVGGDAAWLVIDKVFQRDKFTARLLARMTAETVESLMKSTVINELNIEGGATAAAIIARLGWNRFRVIREISPGVVCVEPEQQPFCLLTLKPGSYAWPEALINTR